MNDDYIGNNLRLFTTIMAILCVSSASTLRPVYPCRYKDLNQRLYQCDMCTCLSSPPMFSTPNLCSSFSPTLASACSANSSRELLRARLAEIEAESSQPFSSVYPPVAKKVFNELEFEFDQFNDDIIENLLHFEQSCSSLNHSRLTFYRLQSNRSFHPCQLSLLSLRFLDTTVENDLLAVHSKPETLIFYNSTLNIAALNLTATSTLAFYYVKFRAQPFVLNSLASLVHLTITHTTSFDLIGSYPNLIYLDLCHTQLDDAQLNKLFAQIDIPDLVTLILSNNHLSALKTKFPSTVRYLDLSNNQIKSLDYTSFKSLYSLNTLNLSYNAPLDIQQDTFTRIPYLEILDLTSSYPSLPFDDLFLPLQKLRYLNVSSNNLNSLPRFPVPYDAHTIASYDHHLPVLYVDMSANNINQIDFDVFSSASTQDKYIISLDLSRNQLKTLRLPSTLSTGVKRRGPLIELNINHNPLQCDCTLYENLSPLLQTEAPPLPPPAAPSALPNQFHFPSVFPQAPAPSQPIPAGFYPMAYSPPPAYLPPNNPMKYMRLRRQLLSTAAPSPAASLLAQNLVKQARIKLLHLSNLTCQDMLESNLHRSLVELTPSNSFCSYVKSCPATCSCCSPSTSPLLFDLNKCDCYYQCPLECACKHSFDATKNYINCSHGYLNHIPASIPLAATHLNLNHNQIKVLGKNLSHLTKLQQLHLSHNLVEQLSSDEFITLTKLDDLDLSSNQIQGVHPRTFSTLFNLRHLQLQNNPWIPKFYSGNGEFQSNTRLKSLSYGKGFVCNRSSLSSALNMEMPLTADDCCQFSSSEACQKAISINEHHLQPEQGHLPFQYSQTPKRFFQVVFHEKYRLYILIGLCIAVLIIVCIIILCVIVCACRRKKHAKHPSPAERKLLSNGDHKTSNHYHKTHQSSSSATPPQISSSSSSTALQKLIHSTRQKNSGSTTAYRQQENDMSVSYSDNDDEDDYASIPLTVSQTELSPVIRPQPAVPPLPPPRQTQHPQQQRSFSNRPVSHSSTVSTSTTIRSIVPMLKRSNSSASKHAQSTLTPARSCLQIKLDALVLYSINDSELVHGNIGESLEDMYGKRFSFYFIHRDRMLGELDWLIENSCVTIIILRKPYHIIHDYMKILSTCSSIKIFLILVNDDGHSHSSSSSSSIKAREKIAKLYRTSNIYEWNANPSALIHEQLELFLEQNCGSATYVPY